MLGQRKELALADTHSYDTSTNKFNILELFGIKSLRRAFKRQEKLSRWLVLSHWRKVKKYSKKVERWYTW